MMKHSDKSVEEIRAALHPSLRDVRAVLFDVGGTLVHPDWPRLARLAQEQSGRTFEEEELRRAMREVLRRAGEELERGAPPTLEERRRGWVFRGMYSTLGLDKDTCELLSERVDAAHGERHLWCGLDPEAPEVLKALKRAGLRVAVISNTEDGRLQELLELVELAAQMDFLIDSYVVGHRKPDAAIFHLALERLRLEPEEAVYVGDSYAHDALAAIKVGMRAVLLDALDLHPESVCPRIRTLGELIRRE
ncbi:MAG TPA: HAD family hydrolase [Pyrinomonadaceae bacterium]|jgi:putative hydrolase of the HAD superfamily